MELFFVHNTEKGLQLRAEEAHHCFHVLRNSTGAVILGTDGAGQAWRLQVEWVATWQHSSGSATIPHKLTVLEPLPNFGEPHVRTGLVMALLKNRDRLEWLLEKAVELGITDLWFVQTERSERRGLKSERVERLLSAGLKQTLRSKLPTIHTAWENPPHFHAIMDSVSKEFHNRFFAYCEALTPLQTHQATLQSGGCCFAIGPEGDFTEAETNLALNHNWLPVSLGTTRLRAETAAIHTLSVAKFCGKW